MKKIERELTLAETVLACIVPVVAMIFARDFMEAVAWTALIERVVYPLIKYLILVFLEDRREQMIKEGTY